MSHNKEPADNRLKETARVETFSDGVFAISITLLVLELIQMLHPQKWRKSAEILFPSLGAVSCIFNRLFDYHGLLDKSSSCIWLYKKNG